MVTQKGINLVLSKVPHGEEKKNPVNNKMERGQYHNENFERLQEVSDNEWRAAIKKCKEHIKLRLGQKKLYGAHTAQNLGEEPMDYYMSMAYEKLLSGDWEWKEKFSLTEQLVRIIDSYVSKEVERVKTKKAEAFKVEYRDIETDFYSLGGYAFEEDDPEQMEAYERRVEVINESVKGDEQLETFWEAVCAGYKRREVAELLDITPKQLDKVKERLTRKVKAYQSSVK